MRQRYELLGPEHVETPVGRFREPTGGATRRSRAAGPASSGSPDDVVVRYDRAFELISYEPGASGPVPTPP